MWPPAPLPRVLLFKSEVPYIGLRMEPFLAVCGHTNIDVLLDLERLPRPGESRPVQARRTVYGGTACNIARHAAGLGVPTRLWSRVGQDFPSAWRSELAATGLDLGHLDIDPELGTPTCFVLSSADGEQSYCMDQAAMKRMVEHPPGPSFVAGMADQAWLHLGTGSPAAWERVLAAARQRGMRVAFDPGQEIHFSYEAESLARMASACDLLWANAREADQACHLLGLDGHEGLLGFSPLVVVTHGADGLVVLRRGEEAMRLVALPVEALDPTGAGDALRAGFYAGSHAGLSLEGALNLGQQAAAACLRMRGPQERTITRALLPPAVAP